MFGKGRHSFLATIPGDVGVAGQQIAGAWTTCAHARWRLGKVAVAPRPELPRQQPTAVAFAPALPPWLTESKGRSRGKKMSRQARRSEMRGCQRRLLFRPARRCNFRPVAEERSRERARPKEITVSTHRAPFPSGKNARGACLRTSVAIGAKPPLGAPGHV